MNTVDKASWFLRFYSLAVAFLVKWWHIPYEKEYLICNHVDWFMYKEGMFRFLFSFCTILQLMMLINWESGLTVAEKIINCKQIQIFACWPLIIQRKLSHVFPRNHLQLIHTLKYIKNFTFLQKNLSNPSCDSSIFSILTFIHQM